MILASVSAYNNTNWDRFNIKPNWVLFKSKNHEPPIYISKYNKQFNKMISYSTDIIKEGERFRP